MKYDIKKNIIILGESNSGKTTLIYNYLYDKWFNNTTGLTFPTSPSGLVARLDATELSQNPNNFSSNGSDTLPLSNNNNTDLICH